MDLNAFSGTYNGQPWGSEVLVVPWYGDLAVLGLPSTNPNESMTVIPHVSGDTFRRVRSDKTLGEEILFVRDASGKVTKYLQHSNYVDKKN